MQDFDYVAAQSVDEVVSLLAEDGKSRRILSGGTDILVQLREGRKSADQVIDIKRVPEVNQLFYDPIHGLTLGAAVPCAKICSDPTIAAVYPGLVDAFSVIGGMQIQGRASIGGNLCNASPAADSIPALIVHQAVCLIAGPHDVSELPVEQFCIAPGRTALQTDEFLLAVRIPPVGIGFGAQYLRFIPRNEMDIAVVGAAAAIQLDQSQMHILSARVALGAVAPTPLLVPEAGEFLAGKEASPENLLEAARMAQAAARPISDMRGTAEQRRHLSLILTRRALTGALARAQAANGRERSNGHSG